MKKLYQVTFDLVENGEYLERVDIVNVIAVGAEEAISKVNAWVRRSKLKNYLVRSVEVLGNVDIT